MKLLRFLSFLLTSNITLLAAFAQTPPAPPQTPAPDGLAAQSEPSAPVTAAPTMAVQDMAEQNATPTLAAPKGVNPDFRRIIVPKRDPFSPWQMPDTRQMSNTGDHRIFLWPSSNDSSCASIVSYNFSPGPDPQLQSVTTCTPSSKTVMHQTRQMEPKVMPLLKTADWPSRP